MAANSRDKLSPDQILAQGFHAYNIPDLVSDDDDDEVTRVMDADEAPDSSRTPTMIPPRVDDGDVYLLTKQHIRFKAGIVAPERVDLVEVMKAPSDLPPLSVSARDTIDELSERDTVTRVARAAPASLAPLAIDATAAPGASRRTPAAALIAGALAVAAVFAVFVPGPRRGPAQPDARPAAQPVAEAEPVVTTPSAGTPIELALVEIVGSVPPSKAPEQGPLAALAALTATDQKVADTEQPEEHASEQAEVSPPAAPVEAPEFDRSAANASLATANRTAASCRAEGVPSFPYVIAVTFAPNGKVTSAIVQGPPYAGTPTGSCIATIFRGASIPAFSGANVTVRKALELP